ncbi:electron transfer flavoprotein subunit beta/FixA family protein [Mahella australiensis]|uniref:Electron transfer flavoprotein small subunit n=1 Tax=Mahella australiensis (strain DSM 15567 / CIP 107919 / 50-1 BON) TaxID=697281 RepID=F4A1J6_MAHA5|nr:electron transfer flavoprotein subunit beta/FixA family protein [Mahella australiensis]AEE96030.1 Electron transfer flavoprotein alpha/beta-subunit [Mahella australiensis 50-1 BON]
MRIVIPIKQVPETGNVKMDEKTGTMIREGVESIINPLDLYAIEVGIRLKEQFGGEIIVLSMGPQKAMEAIREAIAMGCDQGVLISDRKFGGADTWATSYTLSQAIKRIGEFDLVLCGERATDGDTGQVGPGIASFLDLPLSTFTSEIVYIDEHRIQVKRLVEGGYELLELPLPCLLTVVKEISDPRLPTLRGKQRAKKIDVPVWGPDDIDANPGNIGLKGSPTRVVKTFHPQVSRNGKKLVARDAESINKAVDELIEFLKDRQLI